MMGFVTQGMSEADRKKFDDEAKQLLLKQLEYQRGLQQEQAKTKGTKRKPVNQLLHKVAVGLITKMMEHVYISQGDIIDKRTTKESHKAAKY